MATAFGILCGEYGQDEHLLDVDGNAVDSPTVRLALLPKQGRQQRSLYDSVVIGYLKKYEALKARTEKTIRRIAGAAWLKRVRFAHLPYGDERDAPHDLDKTYAALREFLDREVAETGIGLLYLHLNSGTHIQQLNMYRIADRQLLRCPVRLLQTSADRAKDPPQITYKVPHLGLYRYRAPQPADPADTEACNRIRDAFGAGNAEFERSLPRFARIGTRTKEPLLLLGETGTGKTFLAYQIHEAWMIRQGRQKTARDKFHVVNCAGLRPEMAQSEIFGHVKGAFTGAHTTRKGKMLLADKGTLFLDEIGCLDLEVQGMLLKAIEEKTFYPLGADKPFQADFRLICATNHDLSADVVAGQFRHDLYCRINRWQFLLPSLRERDDLPERIRRLLDNWFAENREQYGLQDYRFGLDPEDEAWTHFMAFVTDPASRWPGNIRELMDFVCRLAVRASLDGDPQIKLDVVEEESQRLTEQWRSLDRLPAANVFFEQLREIASKQYLDMCLASAVELWLQDVAQKRHRTQKQAGEELYQPPGKKLSNPGAKLASRRDVLVGRRKRR